MRRTIWMVVSLGVVAAWIVLAYLPDTTLPAFTWPAWLAAPFALLAATGLLLFLVIQAWLVESTDRVLRKGRKGGQAVVREFNLRRAPEMIWTAMPLFMTLALALMAWGLWVALMRG